MHSEYVENTGSKLDRQPDEDCSNFYFDEDGEKQYCILPCGHDGRCTDWSGIEF
jgi:hypothetical protein